MDDQSSRPKMTPKDFFLYLGVAFSLYFSAGSLLTLLFAVIDLKFPDAAVMYYQPSALQMLRFPLSALVIVFPLFLVLSWYTRKEVARDPSKLQLWVRRWFVWGTLFIAGAALIGDAIALLNTFLGGELTTRFILKIIVVLAVAGAIFAYYFYDLRRTSRGDTSVNKPLLYAAAIGVIVSIVLGFLAIGSPVKQRALRFDEQRVGDLQSIQNQVLYIWQQTQKLPATLNDLSDPLSSFIAPTDPETKATYEYKVTGPTSFQICATFTLPSVQNASGMSRAYPGGALDPRFEHGAGHTCFDRTIDPVRYPPFPKAVPVK